MLTGLLPLCLLVLARTCQSTSSRPGISRHQAADDYASDSNSDSDPGADTTGTSEYGVDGTHRDAWKYMGPLQKVRMRDLATACLEHRETVQQYDDFHGLTDQQWDFHYPAAHDSRRRAENAHAVTVHGLKQSYAHQRAVINQYFDHAEHVLETRGIAAFPPQLRKLLQHGGVEHSMPDPAAVQVLDHMHAQDRKVDIENGESGQKKLPSKRSLYALVARPPLPDPQQRRQFETKVVRDAAMRQWSENLPWRYEPHRVAERYQIHDWPTLSPLRQAQLRHHFSALPSPETNALGLAPGPASPSTPIPGHRPDLPPLTHGRMLPSRRPLTRSHSA